MSKSYHFEDIKEFDRHDIIEWKDCTLISQEFKESGLHLTAQPSL